MATTLNVPLAAAADIVEATIAADPRLTVRRLPRVDGSAEITVSRLGYRGWQIVISIFLFPIGLVALAAGKYPKPLGTMIMTPLTDATSSLNGSTGDQALNDKLLMVLGVVPGAPTIPLATGAVVAPTIPPPPPPPGDRDEPRKPDWYTDPKGSHRLRYFDGTQWTDHISD